MKGSSLIRTKKDPVEKSKKRRGPKHIDELDRKIIHELQDDARAPFKDIAKKLRISEETARNRVIKLIDRGVLKLEARVDPFALPHRIPALVGVSLKERDPEQKMREIERIPGVTSVWNTTGPYDLFLKAW